MEFKKEVNKLQQLAQELRKNEIQLSKNIMPTLDFSQSKKNLLLQNILNAVKRLQQHWNQIQLPEGYEELQQEVGTTLERLDTEDNEQFLMAVDTLVGKVAQIPDVEEREFSLPNAVPSDIYPEVEADVNEMQRCFNNGCYRSVVILCGRVLEVILHKKHYEVTENDLLEKSPGIGLGNLIAKMKEKGIELDPGLTQQIHLINQVRVFSVHKKQQPFYPTRNQAQAMMLYTQDSIEKVF